MKTWWNYWPLMVIAFLIPFLIGALPTLDFNNKFYGGGIIRQHAINTIAVELPVAANNKYLNAFDSASTMGEYILYLPIALNCSAILMIATFLFFTFTMKVTNWMKRGEYKSQRKASKGK